MTRLRRVRGSRRSDDPLRVEDAQPQGDEQPGDDPEPDDDGDLVPARELEVVLEGGHPEHTFAGHLERADLDDHRERDDDEQAAEDHDQHLGAGGDGQTCQGAAANDVTIWCSGEGKLALPGPGRITAIEVRKAVSTREAA